MSGHQKRVAPATLRFWGICGLCLCLAKATAADQSYGYLRTVDGPVDLLHSSSRTSVEATANYPIQVGDQLRVSPRGRLEAVLPDGGLVRLGGNTEIRLGRLARSRDTLDNSNLLHLVQGEMQVGLAQSPSQIDGFRIDTANATIYLLESGTYRIFSDGKSWTQVLVREGLAEVVTEEASIRVEPGQQALVDGRVSPRVYVEAAAPADSLEIWGERLATEAQTPFRRGYVTPSLAYAAAPLHRHGTWVKHGRRDVWKPHVSADWRPYHSGWWIYTPSGLTWISTEPWGWVTYHYGAWDHTAGIGWFWQPGSTFTPGTVYWYWGPSYVGWVPAGPYSPYYRDPYYAFPPYGYHGGFHRLGNHRRASTLPRSTAWQNWTFCPYDRFGYRDTHRHLISGAELSRRGVLQTELPTGIVTTETRGLTPDLWESPDRLLERLGSTRSARVGSRSDLSPLGAAAIGTSTSGLGQPVRRWDPSSWRRDNLSLPGMASPYRRDARFSRSAQSSGSVGRARSRTLRGRSGYDHPRIGVGNRASSLGSRPVTPGRPRPILRPSGSGSTRSRQPGRMSGSSRVGKPNGGPG